MSEVTGAGPAGPGITPAAAEAVVRPLARGVHMAEVAEDLVFLDVARDAYHCLPFAAGRVRRRAEGLEIASPELLGDLAAAGLIAASGEADPSFALPDKPRLGLQPWEPTPPRWSDLAEIARACAAAGRLYRRRSLAQLIQSARQGRAGLAAARPDSPPAATLATAADFRRWAPYAPLSAKCLLRSFLLLRVLHDRGLDATWVFAVRTWPFAAHCWLQAGAVALDDEPERLVAYTPILAV